MFSAVERRNALDGALVDCRVDGRQRLDIRPIAFKLNPSSFSIGSASAYLSSAAEGSTVVVAAVSCDVSAAPEEGRGRLLFHVDVSSTDASVNNTKRHEAEAALVRLLEKAYSVDNEDATSAEEAATVPQRVAKQPIRPSDRLKAAARQGAAVSSSSSAALLRELALGHGHCFDLHVDVQLLSGSAGNVVGVMSSAVRAALMATVLPTVTITLGADGSTTAVHIDAKKPLKALSAAAASAAPLVLELAVDPASSIYVADPSPLELTTFPVTARLAVAPGENEHHHRVRWCVLKTSRRAADDADRSDDGVGVAKADLVSVLTEASGALADSALSALRAVEDDQR